MVDTQSTTEETRALTPGREELQKRVKEAVWSVHTRYGYNGVIGSFGVQEVVDSVLGVILDYGLTDEDIKALKKVARTIDFLKRTELWPSAAGEMTKELVVLDALLERVTL